MEINDFDNLDLIKTLNSDAHQTSWVNNDLENEYRALCNTPNGKNLRGITYIFKSKNKINRMRGESNIIYIGQTSRTLWERYSIKDEINRYSRLYSYILEELGGFTVDIIKTTDPVRLESLLLWQYEQIYLELPPMNLERYKESLI